MPEANVPKVGHGPKMGLNEIDRACSCGFPCKMEKCHIYAPYSFGIYGGLISYIYFPYKFLIYMTYSTGQKYGLTFFRFLKLL